MGVFVSGLPLGGGSAPPSGPAGGVLSGTYPNPNLDVPEAIDQLQLGDAAFDDIGTTAGTVASGTLGLTARGQIIRRGAAGPEALAAQTADTFVGGDGTDVTTRTAAQTRASLGVVTATRYGNQPGGDTAWTGWTLGTNVALSGGAVRISPGGAPIGATSVPLLGRAGPRDIRLEWLVKPVSGWDTAAKILYVGTARGTGLTQYWFHRCRGDLTIGVWITQPTTLRPGVELAGVGPADSASTVWLATEIVGGRIQYFYANGTGTGGRTPPVPSAWKLYADYLTSTYSGIASIPGEDCVQFYSDAASVIDVDALTIIPISPAVT